jgi:hypothetical protein
MTWPCQVFEHEPNHCEMDEGCDGCGVPFEVSHQAAVSADPGKAPFDIHRLGKTTIGQALYRLAHQALADHYQKKFDEKGAQRLIVTALTHGDRRRGLARLRSLCVATSCRSRREMRPPRRAGL